jgi:hypothetical protein
MGWNPARLIVSSTYRNFSRFHVHYSQWVFLLRLEAIPFSYRSRIRAAEAGPRRWWRRRGGQHLATRMQVCSWCWLFPVAAGFFCCCCLASAFSSSTMNNGFASFSSPSSFADSCCWILAMARQQRRIGIFHLEDGIAKVAAALAGLGLCFGIFGCERLLCALLLLLGMGMDSSLPPALSAWWLNCSRRENLGVFGIAATTENWFNKQRRSGKADLRRKSRAGGWVIIFPFRRKWISACTCHPQLAEANELVNSEAHPY